uniref:Secreted protein n=1 Tax=Cacopsylla melanoneura TaxID=428564 RepID=A0A8D8YTQ0_9HEMI
MSPSFPLSFLFSSFFSSISSSELQCLLKKSETSLGLYGYLRLKKFKRRHFFLNEILCGSRTRCKKSYCGSETLDIILKSRKDYKDRKPTTKYKLYRSIYKTK